MDVAARDGVAVAAVEADDLDRRMAAEDPDQLAAAVAGRPDDRDPDPGIAVTEAAIGRGLERAPDPRAHRRAGVAGHAWSFAEDGSWVITA